MPRTSKTAAAVSRSASRNKLTDTYIRDTLADLDGVFDREALQLLCTHGILCAEDPAKLEEAVSRLYDSPSHRQKLGAVEAALLKTDLTEKQRELVRDMSDLPTEELIEAVDTAYLLGIAVGRRLGPLALHQAPRPRKAVR